MGRTCCVQKLFCMSKQKQKFMHIMWVSLCENKCFWQRFTCTSVFSYVFVKNLALGFLQGKKRLFCCAVQNTCFGRKRTFTQIECDIYDFMSKSIHASRGMSNWNWNSVQYSMFYPSYTTIINGKAKLFKYQFDVGNLSFMDFPAFTFCKGCEGQPGGW